LAAKNFRRSPKTEFTVGARICDCKKKTLSKRQDERASAAARARAARRFAAVRAPRATRGRRRRGGLRDAAAPARARVVRRHDADVRRAPSAVRRLDTRFSLALA
jgi:hypothetical protein